MGARMLAVFGAVCVGILLASPVAGASQQYQSAPRWLHAWPMAGHDPQRTNRSPVIGPHRLHVLYSLHNFSLRLTGPDGSYYGVLAQGKRVQVVTLDPRARVHIRYHPPVLPLALSPSGILFASNPDDGQIHGFSNGTLLWVTRKVGLFKGAVPLTTEDDRLYAPFVGHPDDRTAALDIVTASGQVLRRIQPGISFQAVSLGPDDTIYAVTHASGAQYLELQALTSAGEQLWKRQLTSLSNDFGSCICPLAGSRGTVLLAEKQFLVAYTRDGGVLWRFHVPGEVLAFAERRNGSLAVATPGSLISLLPGGKVAWRISLVRKNARNRAMSIIVDAQGTAFAAGSNGDLRIVSSTGKVLAMVERRRDPSGFAPTLELTPDGHLATTEADGRFRVYR